MDFFAQLFSLGPELACLLAGIGKKKRKRASVVNSFKNLCVREGERERERFFSMELYLPLSELCPPPLPFDPPTFWPSAQQLVTYVRLREAVVIPVQIEKRERENSKNLQKPILKTKSQ